MKNKPFLVSLLFLLTLSLFIQFSFAQGGITCFEDYWQSQYSWDECEDYCYSLEPKSFCDEPFEVGCWCSYFADTCWCEYVIICTNDESAIIQIGRPEAEECDSPI